jgi:transposase
VSTTQNRSERVVVAIDPHKASWTAAAVDGSLQVLATVRVPVNRTGYRDLRRFASRWPQVSWAIEGATGLGAPLTNRLRADGLAPLDVPAKLAARVRLLSTGHGRKSDEADAVSVAVAALNAARLRSVQVEDSILALRAVVDHRDDLVKQRTQTVNRLHVLLTRLIDGGAPTQLSAADAAVMLRRVRPTTTSQAMLRTVAVDLVGEVRRLDTRIVVADKQIATAVAGTGTTLTDLYGIGPIVAGKILAHVGTVRRFDSSAAFASFNGTAPIEVSSGDVVRHRLSRAGDRQLNHALHMMAITQLSGDTDGRGYYQRKRAAGKGHKEALRCLKRRLSDVVYRQLIHDVVASSVTAAGTSPGGQPGATLESSAAG